MISKIKKTIKYKLKYAIGIKIELINGIKYNLKKNYN